MTDLPKKATKKRAKNTHGWRFTPQADHGGHDAGRQSDAFNQNIDALVREAIQNIWDAYDEWPVKAVFRLITVKGSRLKKFQEALRWNELKDNLEAAGGKRYGGSIRPALKLIKSKKELRLLVVEDHNTGGLTGADRRPASDPTQENNFCSFAKDVGESGRKGMGAGSKGKGKATLISCSSLKTLVFSSVLIEYPEGKEGLRIFGCCDLPWHESPKDGPCAGPGWFGNKYQYDQSMERYTSESSWGEHQAAKALFIDRKPGDTGTSILIVGFSDPTTGSEETLEKVSQKIQRAAVDSFWPAMAEGKLEVEVHIQEDDGVVVPRKITLDDHPGEQFLASMLKRYRDGEGEDKRLESTDELAVAGVKMGVPRRITGPKASKMEGGRTDLVVQLVDPDNDALKEIQGKVSSFRGAMMAVRNKSVGTLSLSAKGFAALLVCGRARRNKNQDDAKVDLFLKTCEPAAHDNWTPDQPELINEYKAARGSGSGAATALRNWDQAVKKKLIELVSVPPEKGGKATSLFSKHLRFGGGDGPTETGKVLIKDDNAHYSAEEGTWNFTGRFQRVAEEDDEERPWRVTLSPKFLSDGKAPDDPDLGDGLYAIEDLKIIPDPVRIVHSHKGVVIDLPQGADQIEYSGKTNPDACRVMASRVGFSLDFSGEVLKKPDREEGAEDG